MATQQDIADQLKISRSLVARVLNGSPGKWASEELVGKIHAAAREMNYRPSAAGRQLRSGRSNTIALTYLRTSETHIQSYLAMLIESVAERLGTSGYRLTVQVFPTGEEILGHLENIARDRSCDAALLPGFGEESAALLTELGLPFVVMGRYEREQPEWPQADFDHEGMMRSAVRHLRDLGHHRIAYVGYQGDAAYIRRLRDGFEQAMAESLGVRPVSGGTASVGSRPEDAGAAVEEWLALPAAQRPTAIVVGGGDWTWRGIEGALAARGRRVGDAPPAQETHFPLCGVSDTAFPLLFGRGNAFCCAAAGVRELGEMIAGEMLLPLLRGETLTEPVRRLVPALSPTIPLADAAQWRAVPGR